VSGTQVDEREARRVAEEAREQRWERPSFARELFLGSFRIELVHPHPRPAAEDEPRSREFLARLERFLTTEVDAAQIERDAKVPEPVVKGLAELGAFGMKIPEEYGGLGLSQVYYHRALMLAASVHPSIGALLSAHQSIGVPQPVKLWSCSCGTSRWMISRTIAIFADGHRHPVTDWCAGPTRPRLLRRASSTSSRVAARSRRMHSTVGPEVSTGPSLRLAAQSQPLPTGA
jgi:hypothetical protein